MGYREDNDNRKKSLCPGMNIGNNLEGYLCKRIDKKRCYWPGGFHGDQIIECSSKKMMMWDVLVANGMRQKSIFFYEGT